MKEQRQVGKEVPVCGYWGISSFFFFKGEEVNSLRAKLTTPPSFASVTPSEVPKEF